MGPHTVPTAAQMVAQMVALLVEPMAALTRALTVVPMAALTREPMAAQTAEPMAALTRALTVALTVALTRALTAELTAAPEVMRTNGDAISTADATASGPGQVSRPAFARLCSASWEQFSTQIWARAPWLSPAADLPADGSPLTLADVDHVLSQQALRTPFLRMSRDGVVAPDGSFTGSGGVGARVRDQILDDAVARLLIDGSTAVLQGLHRSWPPVADLVRTLSSELGHPVQANAYVTPARAQGFAPHYDTHDVFVLQIAGRKRWTIHQPVVRAPGTDQPWTQHKTEVQQRAEQPPALDVELAPGDCLYLPRGWIHGAVALDEVSAHLTLGIHPVDTAAVLRIAAALAEQDPSMRDSLPLGPPDTTTIGQRLAAAVTALTAVEPEQVLERLWQQAHDDVRPEAVRPIAQAIAAVRVGSDTRIRLRQGSSPRLTLSDTSITLRAGRLSLDLTPRHADAVRFILRQPTGVRVGDLPGLATKDQQELARSMLRAGLVLPAGEQLQGDGVKRGTGAPVEGYASPSAKRAP